MYMLQVRFKLRNFFQPRSYFNLGYFAILKRAILIFGVWLKNRGLVFGGFSKRIGCIFKEIKRLVSFPFLHSIPPPSISSSPPPSFKQGKESKASLFISNDFYDQAKTWLGQEGGTFQCRRKISQLPSVNSGLCTREKIKIKMVKLLFQNVSSLKH